VQPEELALDERLARLGRGVGALRLGIGEGLVRLEAVGGVQGLGFPTLESYAREALGRSGRWASDVRGLARRLAGLPAVRAAYLAGRLSTSMVELVVKVATPEDEAAWVERAEAMTVRALRAELARAKVALVEEDERPARVTITTTVDRVDAWAFEQARLMVEAVGASRGAGIEPIEAMLAEGLSELLAREGEIDLPATLTADYEGESRAFRAEMAAIREAAEAAVEGLTQVPRMGGCAGRAGQEPVAPVRGDGERGGSVRGDGERGGSVRGDGERGGSVRGEIDWSVVGEAREIDARLREIVSELGRRDLEIGSLGRRVDERGVWRALGYVSFDHYCRERVGLSPASMAGRVALARRVGGLPEIAVALKDGVIGYEAAAAIGRVAGRATVEAWIERATRRTVKGLREEIEAVEMVARAEGMTMWTTEPPDAATMESVRAIERAVIGLVVGEEGGQMSGGERGAERDGQEPVAPPVAPGRTTLRLSMSESTGRFWRALEALHAGFDEGGSFVAFLVKAVMRSWVWAMPTNDVYRDVYVRDRWRCASPVCRSRNLTPHHIQMRSRGGGEERSNLLSLCDKCHLDLVHGGRLEVSGEAPGGLVWSAAGWSA